MICAEDGSNVGALGAPSRYGWMGDMEREVLYIGGKDHSRPGRQSSPDRDSLGQAEACMTISETVRRFLPLCRSRDIGSHETAKQNQGPVWCPEDIQSSMSNTPLAPSWVCQSASDRTVAKPGERTTATDGVAMQIDSQRWIGRKRSGNGVFHLSPSICQVRWLPKDQAVEPGGQ
jgi:hypothetical protein